MPSYNLNPTGLFPGPDESGTLDAQVSTPYTFLDAGESLPQLGPAESGVYIPLANISDQFTVVMADEALATADYRYLIWALVDQCTEHQNKDSVADRPAGIQFVRGPLYGEGDGITQLYKQKMFFSGGSLTFDDPDTDYDF